MGTYPMPYKQNHDEDESGRQPAEIAVAPIYCEDAYFDTMNVEGIDGHDHDYNCSCGCLGDALIISERETPGAWIASTMDAERYVDETIERVPYDEDSWDVVSSWP